MIIIGVGANLAHPAYGVPREICGRALERLCATGDFRILKRSRWYQSSPVLRADKAAANNAGEGTRQPWYVNAILVVETPQNPQELLDTLMKTEALYGRVRSAADAPRTIDLDIVDYDGMVGKTPTLTLPHPRMHHRAFVIVPLHEVYREWHHPVTGTPVTELKARLPSDQHIGVMPDAAGLFGTEWHGDRHDTPRRK